jgi:hypothetical protein
LVTSSRFSAIVVGAERGRPDGDGSYDNDDARSVDSCSGSVNERG